MKKKTGIYIHFPFCKIKCGYCDFYSIADREDSIPIFIDSLIKEIKLYFNAHDISEFNFDSMGEKKKPLSEIFVPYRFRYSNSFNERRLLIPSSVTEVFSK